MYGLLDKDKRLFVAGCFAVNPNITCIIILPRRMPASHCRGGRRAVGQPGMESVTRRFAQVGIALR